MKLGSSATLFLSLLILSISIYIGESGLDSECVYTVYIRTGSVQRAGTHSKISARLSSMDGNGIDITNLESWGGVMGPGHNYFETGQLDVFSGPGPCLAQPICALNLTSDGSGPYHGWYCNYFEVTSTGVHIPCSKNLFNIDQWLATDSPPYQLYAYRNNCPKEGYGDGNGDFNGVINSAV